MNIGNAVVVVAHPDDEVLWSGGLITRYKLDVICCSIPRMDTIRAYKFFDSCKALGATGRLLPFVESDPSQDLLHLEHLDLDEYDTVFTHNEAGEYGHHHHKQIHKYVKSIHKNVVCFQTEGFKIKLTQEELAKKHKALESYNHICPYTLGNIPKWQALWHRYIELEGVNFEEENFG